MNEYNYRNPREKGGEKERERELGGKHDLHVAAAATAAVLLTRGKQQVFWSLRTYEYVNAVVEDYNPAYS